MDSIVPTITPRIFQAYKDIVFDVVGDEKFLDQFNNIFEPIHGVYPLIKKEDIDRSQIRFTVPLGNIRSIEAELALHFVFLVIQNYHGDDLLAWKHKDEICDLLDTIIEPLTHERVITVTDKLIKTLINKHYQIFCFGLNQHSGHSRVYCVDCHNIDHLVNKIQFAQGTLKNWYLIHYEKNEFTKWIFRKRIPVFHQVMDEIKKANESIQDNRKELIELRTQIREFLQSDSVSTYDQEKVEALYHKQHALYQEIVAIMQPSLDKANALKEKYDR